MILKSNQCFFELQGHFASLYGGGWRAFSTAMLHCWATLTQTHTLFFFFFLFSWYPVRAESGCCHGWGGQYIHPSPGCQVQEGNRSLPGWGHSNQSEWTAFPHPLIGHSKTNAWIPHSQVSCLMVFLMAFIRPNGPKAGRNYSLLLQQKYCPKL